METASLFKRILDFTGDGVYRYSFDDSRVLYCNPGFVRILDLDLPPEAVVGRRLDELMVYTERTGTVRQAIDRTGEIHGFEYHFQTLKGEDRWVIHDSFIIEENGMRIVEAVVKDQTAVIQARQALLEEKERLAVTLRSIGDGVIATDTDGRVQMLNKAAESLTGWKQAEAAGRPLTEVFDIRSEYTREVCPNPVARVLAEGVVVGLANHTLLIARDGVERPIADSSAPIRDSGSRVIGAVLVFRDATQERLKIEEATRLSKLDSLGVLAGGIAHDFNNVLTSILGSIALARLANGSSGPPRANELLESAETACFRAKDLTGQLLTFAKGGDPVKKTADLGGIVRESAAFALTGSNCKARFDIAPDLKLAEVDPGQIGQVVQNLVINAMQAMPDGGLITVGARNVASPTGRSPDAQPAAPCVELWVSDTGVGIPAKHLPRIFDPYFTTKQKGSGFGLSVTHTIIERHRGKIRVETKLGAGTTFRITLPATDQPRHPAREPATRGQAAGRVLLMDDEPSILRFSGAMLESLGYTVTGAADGASAVALFAEAHGRGEPFDLVILDLTVPGGMGGREAIKRMRELDPEVKAIVSSGYSTDAVLGNHAAHGFSGVLTKPYRLAELSEAVAAVQAG